MNIKLPTSATQVQVQDSVTVLTCAPGKRAHKIFRADGTIDDYDAGGFFSIKVVPVGSLLELAAVIENARTRTDAFLIYGEPVQPWREPVPRKWVGENPTLRATAHYWLCLDFDHTIAKTLDELRESLPIGMREACCIWLASAKARPGEALRGKLFVWFSRPISLEEAESIAKQCCADPSVARAGQPIYVGDPKFEAPLVDPYPDRNLVIEEGPLATVPEALPYLDNPKLLQTQKPNRATVDTREAVAIDWCKRAPAAIQGQGGHDALFDRACELIKGYGFDPDTASTLLAEHYNGRCDPPFEVGSQEWQHKIEQAEQSIRDEGYLLTDTSDAATQKPTREANATPDAKRRAKLAAIGARVMSVAELYEAADAQAQAQPEFIEGLNWLAPGTLPTLIAGWTNEGKSWIALEMARALSTGGLLFGKYPCRKCRVLYADWELGAQDSAQRKRMLGVDPTNENLLYVTMQHGETIADLVDMLRESGEQVDVLIVETLRGAAAGDENSSDFTGGLRVLPTLGCAVLVTHHTTKSDQQIAADDYGAMLRNVRGTSDIVGACSNVLFMVGSVVDGCQLAHAKARGAKSEPVPVKLEFVGAHRATLTTTVEPGAPIAPIDDIEAVARHVRHLPGGSRNGIAQGLHMRPQRVQAALEVLASGGSHREPIHNAGTDGNPKWCPILARPDIEGRIPTVAQATWARWYCPDWWREIAAYVGPAFKDLVKAADKSKSPPSTDFPYNG